MVNFTKNSLKWSTKRLSWSTNSNLQIDNSNSKVVTDQNLLKRKALHMKAKLWTKDHLFWNVSDFPCPRQNQRVLFRNRKMKSKRQSRTWSLLHVWKQPWNMLAVWSKYFLTRKLYSPHVFSQLWGWCHEEGGKNALNYIGKHNIDLYGQTQQFFSINLLFNLVFF